MVLAREKPAPLTVMVKLAYGAVPLVKNVTVSVALAPIAGTWRARLLGETQPSAWELQNWPIGTATDTGSTTAAILPISGESVLVEVASCPSVE